MNRRGETAAVHQGRDVERMKKVTVTWAQAGSQTTGLQMCFVGTLGAVRMTSDLQWWGPHPTSSLCPWALSTITDWNCQGLARQDPEAGPFLGGDGAPLAEACSLPLWPCWTFYRAAGSPAGIHVTPFLQIRPESWFITSWSLAPFPCPSIDISVNKLLWHLILSCFSEDAD